MKKAYAYGSQAVRAEQIYYWLLYIFSLFCLKRKVHSCRVPACKPEFDVPGRRVLQLLSEMMQLPPTLILHARLSAQGKRWMCFSVSMFMQMPNSCNCQQQLYGLSEVILPSHRIAGRDTSTRRPALQQQYYRDKRHQAHSISCKSVYSL